MLDVPRIRAVVFDMDDTLLDWRQAEARAIASLALHRFAPLGVPEERVRLVYGDVMQENYRSWRETRRWWYVAERLQMLCERLGVADRLGSEELAQAFTQDVTAHLELLDGALAALRTARSGRRTAILTNGRSEVQRPKVEAFRLHEEVDFVGITGEMGAWKPDPAAFHIVLERLGVEAHATLMVGDNLDFDIGPAKRLGMQTAWVGQGTHADADLVLATPGQLVPVLQGDARSTPTAEQAA